MLRRIRRGASVAAVGGALLALFGTLLVAAPATAAGETAVLQIDKSVNKTSLAPNDTLNYTIDINCLSDNCVGAQLVDTLPPQFDVLTLNPTVTVSGGTATYSWGGTN